MKAQDLVKLIDKLIEKKIDLKIRQLIKEEVSSQVNTTMGKILIEVFTKNGGLNKNEDIHEQNTPTPINTNNPKLNAVLAETAKNFKPLKKNIQGNLAELLDGNFEKIGQNEDVSYEEHKDSKPAVKEIINDNTNVGFLKQMVSEGTTTGTPQQSVLGTSAVPDALKGVFKRDFRTIMKKIDEQKKFGSQGLINPQMVLSG